MTGNQVGLTAGGLAALTHTERDALRDRARASLAEAGAHYVVDTLAELPACLDAIEAQLARGERP